MNKTDDDTGAAPCPLCAGTLCLSQYGIFKIFLMPAKFPLLLILAGIIGMTVFSKYMLLLSFSGIMIPLASADFRLFMYPVAAVADLLGKAVNCPRCNPFGSVFRR
ncbi:hypothetical protein P0136_09015 [Lentisphaerota bacterium ZTH]|nr:hypothetical protein JYG24_13475 [Lentisphaerota bacterium]WET05503.1 hypothetical protein P0136_09015 [Lentisphaerota bacterium ZTH]